MRAPADQPYQGLPGTGANYYKLDLVDAGRAVYDLLLADDGRWTSPTAYRAIYETTQMEDGSAAQGRP